MIAIPTVRQSDSQTVSLTEQSLTVRLPDRQRVKQSLKKTEFQTVRQSDSQTVRQSEKMFPKVLHTWEYH